MNSTTTRAALAGAVSIPLLVGAVTAPAAAADDLPATPETVSTGASASVAPVETAPVPVETAPAPAAPVEAPSDETAAPLEAPPAPVEAAAPLEAPAAVEAPAPVEAPAQSPTVESPAAKSTTSKSTSRATTTKSATTKSRRVDVSARGVTRRSARVQAPTRHRAPHKFGTVSYNKWYATHYMEYKYGWGKKQRSSLIKLWMHESGWNQRAHNGSSGAHGIPQALPGNKMSSHGKHWVTNPETQIKWGLSYIKGRYGSPNKAWRAWQHKGWY